MMNKFPPYKILDDLILRCPFYSFVSYDSDRLQEVLIDPGFQNGLFLASPAFYGILKAKGFDLSALTEKEIFSVCKYYNRMCYRPTPFGSFASVSLLKWGSGDTVRLACREDMSLHLLPDAKLLPKAALTTGSEDSGPLIKNPMLYKAGNEFRFVKSDIDPAGRYRFSLDAVPASEFYIGLFGLFDQPVSKRIVLDWITLTSGCTPGEASEFLEFLLTEHMLYHPETGHIVGISPARNKDSANAGTWSKYNPLTVRISASLPVIAAEAAFYFDAPTSQGAASYLYAGLTRAVTGGGPGPADREEIARAVELLRRLTTPYKSPRLEKFTADFQERFDRRKVPLLTALDPDSGVAYGKFGISGLSREFGDIELVPARPKADPVEWSPLCSRLMELWMAAQEKGRYAPLRLSLADISAPGELSTAGAAPPTLAVMFRKIPDQMLIEYAGGATATALAGRFSVFDDQIEALCRKLAALEAKNHDGVIFADIGQLSDEHADNINRRLQIYPAEIPLNVYSVLEETQQIKPEDLTLSVIDGQLILESVKLAKRVIPRLASAYNYHHNDLAIFRLLGDLQYQGLGANFNFNLEAFFPGLGFYPRVTTGRTIISPARWKFNQAEIQQIANVSSSDGIPALKRFREHFELPQKISTGNFDQQLVFDLSSQQEALFFLRFIKGLNELTVTEYLKPDRSVKAGHEPLAGQFIAFLHHDEKIYHAVAESSGAHDAVIRRSFFPGDDWLYVKLFCTPASSGRILAEVIWPLIKEYEQKLSKWFFVRYAEHGYHLRLRFLIPAEFAGELLVSLKQHLKGSGNDSLVRNYQADTYQREMERYAGVMELAEDLFNTGSELFLRYLALTNTDDSSVSEFFLGLWTSYRMIACFLADITAVKEFTRRMSDNFLESFGDRKKIKEDMDMKYRSMKSEVESLLAGPPPLPALKPASSRFLAGATAIANSVGGQDPQRSVALLADLVHMQLNRTFAVKHRTHEFMVYYFLYKYALSREARAGARH